MPTPTELAQALTRLKNNDRVTLIRISVPAEACPVCRSLQGAYPKDSVPALPPEGCSCPFGRTSASYDPVLAEIYP
ncbi:MAG: hypothetical protein JNK29_07285 [Anaerolineales bacterium]|nr:hypothetical protein [Anaerolineales bacterium]